MADFVLPVCGEAIHIILTDMPECSHAYHTVAMQTGRVQASSAAAVLETVVAALAAGEAEPVAAIGQHRGTRL